MSSTFTTRKQLEKQGNNDNSNTWEVALNAALDYIDEMTHGIESVNCAGSSDQTPTDPGNTRARIFKLTGILTGNINLILPAREGMYHIWNATTGAFTVTAKPASGTGIVVPQSARADYFTDGSVMYAADNDHVGTYLSLSVAGSADVTLTETQAMARVLKLTGALTASISVIVPAREGQYAVWNATTGDFTVTFKPASGTGILVPQGGRLQTFTDGATAFDLSQDYVIKKTATGASSVDFDLPAAYDVAEFDIEVKPGTATALLLARVSIAASVQTGASYNYNTLLNSNGAVSGARSAGMTSIGLSNGLPTAAGYVLQGFYRLLNYTGTAAYKWLRGSSTHLNSAGSAESDLSISGYWGGATSALDKVRFLMSTGTFDYTIIMRCRRSQLT